MGRGVASSTTLMCSLLFLFTFSSARSPFDLTGIDIDHTNHDSFTVSEKNPADANANILLPNEKPEFKPATLIQWELETTDSETSQPKVETIESIEVPKESSEASDPLPFTVFNFRPMDPRIPRRPLPLSFRLGHRCHHTHHYKPWKPRLPHREIPYHKDVILNNVQDKDFDPVARGGVRQIPAEWMRFSHIEPMFFSRERSMAMERSELLRRFYNRHHHHRGHEPENKDTGLMKRIRKFLNHF